jgi:putative thioredoxin
MSQHTAIVTMENARQVLIDESFQRLVVVDFWADWCAPCKTLMPLLEKLAAEYDGQFLLAKVNADDEQQIAMQFGVRSLPTIVLMKDGQPVDGLSGAVPEKELRALLEKYLPKPWDALLDKARAAMAEQRFSEALPLLKQAHDESHQRADITITLALVNIEMNRFDEAETLLKTVKMAHQDGYYQQVLAQLELKREAAKSPEISALETRLNSNPDDLDTAYQLALQFSQHNQHREAMTLLINILQQQREFQDGAAKRSLLDIFKSLGNKDPLVVEFQRKLFSLLY